MKNPYSYDDPWGRAVWRIWRATLWLSPLAAIVVLVSFGYALRQIAENLGTVALYVTVVAWFIVVAGLAVQFDELSRRALRRDD